MLAIPDECGSSLPTHGLALKITTTDDLDVAPQLGSALDPCGYRNHSHEIWSQIIAPRLWTIKTQSRSTRVKRVALSFVSRFLWQIVNWFSHQINIK